MRRKYLVTGASGYIGMHVVERLLKEGHQVRATVRNMKHKDKVSALKKLGSIEIVEADLQDTAEIWSRALKNIDVVIHLAQPVNSDESAVIRLAVEGTLNILRAALTEKVKRVVIMSLSLSSYGFQWKNRTYSRDEWIDVNDLKTPCEKSKLLAEKAAWEFYEANKLERLGCFDLVSILPVWVLGPVLNATSSSSVVNFSRLFYEMVDKVENVSCAICDVRDVALALIRACELDNTIGRRILVTSTHKLLSTSQLAEVLSRAGYKVATVDEKTANFDKFKLDDSDMRNRLGIEPIEIRRTIVDMAESLVKFGIVKLVSNE